MMHECREVDEVDRSFGSMCSLGSSRGSQAQRSGTTAYVGRTAKTTGARAAAHSERQGAGETKGQAEGHAQGQGGRYGVWQEDDRRRCYTCQGRWWWCLSLLCLSLHVRHRHCLSLWAWNIRILLWNISETFSKHIQNYFHRVLSVNLSTGLAACNKTPTCMTIVLCSCVCFGSK